MGKIWSCHLRPALGVKRYVYVFFTCYVDGLGQEHPCSNLCTIEQETPGLRFNMSRTACRQGLCSFLQGMCLPSLGVVPLGGAS
jgi:hypothetical protein